MPCEKSGLTLFGFIPGIIHAFYVILKH
ncbi:YqaE/Pmp3 family membrane protein [Vreelandella glaciei]